MKIKGAIFDMDGTVIDSLMFWDYLWNRIGKKYMNDPDFKPNEDTDKKVRTMIFSDAMAYFHNLYNIHADAKEFFEFTADGIPDFYRNVATVKPGAFQLLDHLKAQGIAICLASATSMPEIKLALEHHGLAKYFSTVLSCVDIGVGKDKPDIYLEASRLMGLDTSDICVFEDSYIAIQTAKKVGFKTIGLFDKYNFEQERLKNSSDIYMSEGQTLDSLIVSVCAKQ